MKIQEQSFSNPRQFKQKRRSPACNIFTLILSAALLVSLNIAESMIENSQQIINDNPIVSIEQNLTKIEQSQDKQAPINSINTSVITEDNASAQVFDIIARRRLKSIKSKNNLLFSSYSQIKQLNTIDMKAPQTKNLFQKRGKLGYAYKNQPTLNMWIIINQKQEEVDRRQCFIINSVLIVTQQVITNVRNILSQNKTVKIFILTTNEIQDEMVKNFFKEVGAFKLKVKIDSDYQFLLSLTKNCFHIAYTFSNFKITEQMANKMLVKMDNLPYFSMFYSSKCLYRNKQKQLTNLTSTNLQSIKTQQFYNYIFILDTKLLQHSTPLNFAYFAKYTLEQIIILPLLAMIQQSGKLVTDNQIYHQINTNFVYFQQFRINAPPQQVKSISFISYPSNPSQISEPELNQYLSSFDDAKFSEFNITLIIHLPYKFGKSNILLPIYQKLHSLSLKHNFSRIKLRIRANKTVSTLAIYQSVYTYCPNKSLIVSSRHNVKFKSYFIQYIFQNLQERYHIYFANYLYNNNKIYLLPSIQLQFTKLAQHKYRDYFQHFQIFKSDLMKNMLFWLLKSQQVDFYQNQYVFVTYWMEQLQHQFKYLNKQVVIVSQRNKTAAEQKQLKNLMKYMVYSPYSGRLIPYLINCLQNEAYRRNAPQKIQKYIHQVWIGQKKMSALRWRLHQSLIQKNPNFNVKLWTFENITHHNLPIGTRYRQKILQLDSVSRYSYLAAVADVVRFEIVYTYGGIYGDFKYQGLKPMDNFLKYQILFLDTDTSTIRFDKIKALTYSFIGGPKNSYYFKMILTEQIRQQQIKFQGVRFNFLHILGSFALRKVFTYEEVFSVINLGFHLIYPTHYSVLNQCEREVEANQNNKVASGKQVFYVKKGDDQNKILQVALPCQNYEQSYMLNYISLGKTWVTERRDLDKEQLSKIQKEKDTASSSNKL